MRGTRWAVLCADGEERHDIVRGLSKRGAEIMAHLDLDFPLVKCGPHRVVERLTDPEPWLVNLLSELERFAHQRGGILPSVALADAYRAVPEVWREAAREATP